MKAFRKALDAIARFAAWVAAAATILMMLHVTADVTGRNLFNAPIVGTVEISANYYMVALSFLPLALITKERGHIIVELFTGWMNLRWRTLVDATIALVTLTYVAIFTWKAVAVAIEKTHIREAKEAGIGFVEIWPSRWVVPIGFGLMTIFILIYMIQDFRHVASNRMDEEDEARHPGGAPHIPDSERDL